MDPSKAAVPVPYRKLEGTERSSANESAVTECGSTSSHQEEQSSEEGTSTDSCSDRDSSIAKPALI
jgi:hypothetical protein